MSRDSMYSFLDRFTSSLEPQIVCAHKFLCTNKSCKRKELSNVNSVAYVPVPDGWNNCKYYIK